MKFVSSEALIWEYLAINDIYVGRSKDLVVSDLLDIVHIRLQPNHTLRAHYHNRPGNGHQVFYFHQGGKLAFSGRTSDKILYDQRAPFYFIIGSGPDEVHSITNLGSHDLEFVCMSSPQYEGPSEEIHV